ncbi:hypothetical protein LCGC14_3043780, partial [marine sediment metagenome]
MHYHELLETLRKAFPQPVSDPVHDGYVVFVQGGFPGDVVVAEVTRAKRDYGNARVVDLIEPSNDRVAERCRHEGSGCPGSPWQALRYESQLEHKQALVGDALERLGKLPDHELEPIVPATDVWRYRNKLEYSFGERDTSGDETALVLGFHARGNWEQIEDAHDCMLASERSNSVRNLVRDWCAAEGLSAYDRREATGFLRNLVVREGRHTGALQVRLVTSEGDFRAEEFADVVRSAQPSADVLWTRTSRPAEGAHGGSTSVL